MFTSLIFFVHDWNCRNWNTRKQIKTKSRAAQVCFMKSIWSKYITIFCWDATQILQKSFRIKQREFSVFSWLYKWFIVTSSRYRNKWEENYLTSDRKILLPMFFEGGKILIALLGTRRDCKCGGVFKHCEMAILYHVNFQIDTKIGILLEFCFLHIPATEQI